MAMQLEVLKDEGHKLQLHAKKTSVGVMNAVRRTIVSELPCYAVDRVDFYENNSALVNEYLANRIGLIPLTWEESVAEGAQVSLSLNAEGPCMVYSRDIRSSDEKIKVFNENIPLVKLAADQRLRFEAFAIKGKGKTHAKFQSAMASYGLVPKEGKVTGIADIDRDDKDGVRDFREDEFVLAIESYNNVPAKEHVLRALNMLVEKTEILEKSKELK